MSDFELLRARLQALRPCSTMRLGHRFARALRKRDWPTIAWQNAIFQANTRNVQHAIPSLALLAFPSLLVKAATPSKANPLVWI